MSLNFSRLRYNSRLAATGRQAVEVERLAVEQVGRPNVFQAVEHGLDSPGVALLPVAQKLLHLLALHVLLRAAQVAGDDRKLLQRGVGGEIALLAVRQRADDDVLAVVRAQLGRHRLHLTAVEKIEQKSLEDVVAVMPQRDLGRAQFAGYAVEHAPAQP